MANQEPKEPFGYQKPALDDHELATKLERVDELVSLMLDDELDDPKVTELEGLLMESQQARSQYVGMIQLHTDLMEYYNPQSTLGAASPILAQLTQSVDATAQPSETPADKS
ncbi:hypothetical protein [Aeoliella sp.]|uniref:hypothetical protein n=1 Tax=Aeoliella sp. TaxID=2795800 RepID=UPI003CCBDE7E